MDNRLIFLYQEDGVISEGGTQKGRHSRLLEVPVQARRGMSQENPGCHSTPRSDGEAERP